MRRHPLSRDELNRVLVGAQKRLEESQSADQELAGSDRSGPQSSRARIVVEWVKALLAALALLAFIGGGLWATFNNTEDPDDYGAPTRDSCWPPC